MKMLFDEKNRKMLKCSDLKINEEYRQLVPAMEDEQFERIFADVPYNGILEPIKVNRENVIIDGHHRFRAANKYNIAEVPVVYPLYDYDGDEELIEVARANSESNKGRSITKIQVPSIVEELEPSYKRFVEKRQSAFTSLQNKHDMNIPVAEMKEFTMRYGPGGRTKELMALDLPVGAKTIQRILTVLHKATDIYDDRAIDIKNRLCYEGLSPNKAYQEIVQLEDDIKEEIALAQQREEELKAREEKLRILEERRQQRTEEIEKVAKWVEETIEAKKQELRDSGDIWSPETVRMFPIPKTFLDIGTCDSNGCGPTITHENIKHNVEKFIGTGDTTIYKDTHTGEFKKLWDDAWIALGGKILDTPKPEEQWEDVIPKKKPVPPKRVEIKPPTIDVPIKKPDEIIEKIDIDLGRVISIGARKTSDENRSVPEIIDELKANNVKVIIDIRKNKRALRNYTLEDFKNKLNRSGIEYVDDLFQPKTEIAEFLIRAESNKTVTKDSITKLWMQAIEENGVDNDIKKAARLAPIALLGDAVYAGEDHRGDLGRRLTKSRYFSTTKTL